MPATPAHDDTQASIGGSLVTVQYCKQNAQGETYPELNQWPHQHETR